MTERGRAQPVEHGLQVNPSVGCSKAQRCELVDHLQSTMTSYSHSVSFVHQQKDGLEFGRKRYRFALTCNQGDQPFSQSSGPRRLQETESRHPSFRLPDATRHWLNRVSEIHIYQQLDQMPTASGAGKAQRKRGIKEQNVGNERFGLTSYLSEGRLRVRYQPKQ